MKAKNLIGMRFGKWTVIERTQNHVKGIRTDNRIENLELWKTSQPYGQRVEDLIESAIEILETYAPNYLNKNHI